MYQDEIARDYRDEWVDALEDALRTYVWHSDRGDGEDEAFSAPDDREAQLHAISIAAGRGGWLERRI